MFVLQPLVAGPDAIPVVDDALVARADPELAVLSALAHPVGKVIDALAEWLRRAVSADTAEDPFDEPR